MSKTNTWLGAIAFALSVVFWGTSTIRSVVYPAFLPQFSKFEPANFIEFYVNMFSVDFHILLRGTDLFTPVLFLVAVVAFHVIYTFVGFVVLQLTYSLIRYGRI